MFKEVRRKDRILQDTDRITELLQTSEYGFLSMGISNNGYAYGIPISYAYDEEMKSLYFHSALIGEKLDTLRQNNKVSFCVVGKTAPIADQFTTIYESIIAFGTVNMELSDEDKRKALKLLAKKYSPEHEELSNNYIDKSWNRTFCFKIDIDHISAKAKY